MKNNKKIVNVTTIIVIMIIIITIWQCFKIVDTPLKIKDEEIIEVAEGDSFYGVLNKLSEEDKIKNEFLVKLYLKIRGIKPEVLAGTYKLDNSMTLDEIITLLSNDSTIGKIYITIPEGYTIDDIAEKLEENNICSSEDFINSVKNYDLPAYVSNNPNKRYNLEGFLFPDTYSFNENENADFVVKTMINRFEEVWQELVQSLNLSIADDEIEKIVNVASIIEKEAVVGRMGGDEFIVIIRSDDGRIDYETFRKKLQHVIDEYNHKESRFKYSVACGYADSTEAGDNNGNVDARQIYSMADDRMYVHKRKIKEKMKQEKSHNE